MGKTALSSRGLLWKLNEIIHSLTKITFFFKLIRKHPSIKSGRYSTMPMHKKGFSDSSVGKESAWQSRRPQFDSWVGKIRWRRDRLPTPIFLGFLCGSAGKESACNVGDLGSIPGLGRSPGEGKGYPLQYSGLENSMDCIYSPWGGKESDMTKQLSLPCTHKKDKHGFYKHLVILD